MYCLNKKQLADSMKDPYSVYRARYTCIHFNLMFVTYFIFWHTVYVCIFLFNMNNMSTYDYQLNLIS